MSNKTYILNPKIGNVVYGNYFAKEKAILINFFLIIIILHGLSFYAHIMSYFTESYEASKLLYGVHSVDLFNIDGLKATVENPRGSVKNPEGALTLPRSVVSAPEALS